VSPCWQGTSGNNVATDRTNGFNQQLAPVPEHQDRGFADGELRPGHQSVEQILQSNRTPGVYAQNDTMALGAIQAIKAAGKSWHRTLKIRRTRRTQQACRRWRAV